MKFVKLLAPAHVAGRLRHPHEGVLPVSDDDARRLVDEEKLAEDVTADFADADTTGIVPEPVSYAEPDAPDVEPAPSQSDVEPQATTDTKPKASKASADKE